MAGVDPLGAVSVTHIGVDVNRLTGAVGHRRQDALLRLLEKIRKHRRCDLRPVIPAKRINGKTLDMISRKLLCCGKLTNDGFCELDRRYEFSIAFVVSPRERLLKALRIDVRPTVGVSRRRDL